MTEEEKPSYGRILTSTSVIGGATFVGVLVTAVRTKVFSVLLGPSGFALFSLYGAVTNVISTVATVGIGSSGVRQVAMARETGDPRRMARAILTLRRTSLVLGVLGGAVLLALSAPLSRLTFGDPAHAGALALLSLMVPLAAVHVGQTALVQGVRRIRHLAAIRIFGALLGLVLAVPLVVFLRERGIAPAMIVTAGALMAVSWYFARRVRIEVRPSWGELSDEVKGLVGLGVAIMTSNLMMTLANYFIRTSIVRQLGLDAAGHYQAAFTLAAVYVGMILAALGADFYPRLTAAARDDRTANRLVNEQSLMVLLLVGPGLVATLALAPLLIEVFYSEKFLPAVEVVRWQILGILGRIVSWPMAFVILAKGRGRIFAANETLANVVHVLLVVQATRTWGLVGAGIAFFGFYLFYTVITRLVVGWLSGFRWSGEYFRALLLVGASVGGAFAASRVLDPTATLVFRCAIAAGAALYSFRSLQRLLGPDFVRRGVDRVRRALGRPPGS